ncbi:MAG: response regulator [Burkholderiaceae bacterium]|nr:MAG: response regulator [Burkholderiaceae bacterium]
MLLVDDEANILTSLKRLLRPTGYKVLTADSGPAGLEILTKEKVDLIISDMRMPNMSGAEFLQHVRTRDPNIVRILLTGFSDLVSTVEAINKGEIFRYISKPWDDREILMIVKQGLDTKRLVEEKRCLEQKVQEQNAQLREWNTKLENKVHARTKELHQTMQFLEQAHGELKKGFITSIKVFSNLIDMREGAMAGHSRRVADLARSLATRMKMAENEIQDVFLAALLHDIGKLGLPDSVIRKPYASLTQEEREEVHKHPVKGQTVLMALEQLTQAALLIRHHHERFDGQGYPDALPGLSIPLGARILAVANDYDALISGAMQMRKLSREEALQDIRQNSGKRYDPTVVLALTQLMGGGTPERPSGKEMETTTDKLAPGMVLSRDLLTRDGILLLARDYLLDERIIGQILHYEKIDGRSLHVFISVR